MKKALIVLLALLMVLPLSLTAFAASDQPLTLDHVWQVDDKHLVLEFSEDIVLGSAYIAIRWCTVSNGRPTLAWKGSEPLQYAPSGGDFLDGRRILLTFKESLNDLLKKSSPYVAYLAIEELAPPTNDHTGLWDVVAAANPKKQLVPNRAETGGNWDGVYIIPEYKPDYGSIEIKAPSEPIYLPDMDAVIGKQFPEPKPYEDKADETDSPAQSGEDTAPSGKSGCGGTVSALALPLTLLFLALPLKKKH